MAKGRKTGETKTIRGGLLDYFEWVLLAFFVLMDSIALLFLPGPMWSKIIVLVAAILLVVVLGIRFYQKSHTW
jgi:membrane protein implicated in regulation of membrane protease activity